MENTSIEEIKKEVDNAFNKVFNGNTRENRGTTDNHCSQKTLEYYRGIYDNSQEASQTKEELFSKLDKFDLDEMAHDE